MGINAWEPKRGGKTKGGIKGGKEKRRGYKDQEVKNFGVEKGELHILLPNPYKTNPKST
jgi:hypothetical protein